MNSGSGPHPGKAAGPDLTETADEHGDSKAAFLPILLYVLGFMFFLGLLAFVTAWVLRR